MPNNPSDEDYNFIKRIYQSKGYKVSRFEEYLLAEKGNENKQLIYVPRGISKTNINNVIIENAKTREDITNKIINKKSK